MILPCTGMQPTARTWSAALPDFKQWPNSGGSKSDSLQEKKNVVRQSRLAGASGRRHCLFSAQLFASCVCAAEIAHHIIRTPLSVPWLSRWCWKPENGEQVQAIVSFPSFCQKFVLISILRYTFELRSFPHFHPAVFFHSAHSSRCFGAAMGQIEAWKWLQHTRT